VALGAALLIPGCASRVGACQTKTDENQLLDHARPPEPDGNRELKLFKFIALGVMVGLFLGIILGCLFMWETEVRAATLCVGIFIAIATMVGCGWVGWQIGLRWSN
jgi:hypothetical protein